MVDPTACTATRGPLLADARTVAARPTWSLPGTLRAHGDVIAEGHFRSDRSASKPSISMLPEAGADPPPPTLNGTDSAGLVYFGTGSGAARGGLVRVTFVRAFTTTPAVVICPINSAAASRPFYVAPNRSFFDIALGDVPASRVTPLGFAFSYVVLG